MDFINDNSTYSNESIPNVTVAPGPGPKFTPPQWWFGQIFPWFIIIFGTFGNCAVLFVLRHQKYGKISTCFYMKALALSDNFVMILLFIRWLSRVPGSPLKMNTAFCVGYFFSVRFGFGMSAWTLMFMTVDRYISVKWPLKARELCTIKRAVISLIIIAIIQVVSHLPYFWRVYDPNPITLSGQCPYNMPKEFTKVYLYLRMLVTDRVLPWLLTLGFTVAMSVELYRGTKMAREMLGENSKTKEKLSRRVTAMSLIVSWMFFFLTFPTSIDYGIRVANLFRAKEDKIKMSAFIYDLWVYFLYLNSALNFWLYIAASGKFREDFKVMTMALFGVELKRTTTKGSLSYGSTSRKASDSRVSGVGHLSPNHAIHPAPNKSGSTKSPLPTINGSTEYQNPEFTRL